MASASDGVARLIEAGRLVMLVGMPRSGTTWLGKIFDSHPDTVYFHEPDSRLIRPDEIPPFVEVEDLEKYRAPFVDYVQAIMRIRTTRVLCKMPIFPRRDEGGVSFALRRWAMMGLRMSTRVLGDVSVPGFVGGSAKGEHARIVWKSIESLGRVGVLARALPGARGVFIVRHPCGYVASVLRGAARGRFSDDTAPGEDWGMLEKYLDTKPGKERGLTLDDLRGLSPVERLAWCWGLANEKMMRDIEGLENCTYFRYESLCDDPVSVTRELFDHAGLDWNPQTERFVGESTSRTEGAYYSVYKDPRQAAMKWKKELPADDIAKIMAIARKSKAGELYPDD